MKYELWDVYETEIFDTGELLCKSDDMAEIRAAAKGAHQGHRRRMQAVCKGVA